MAIVGILLDVSLWPIVVTTPSQTDVSDAQLQDFLQRYTELLKAHPDESHIDVLDLRGNTGISARQRQALNDWTKDVMPRLPCRCVGNALVFSSPLLRGMLTAMLWMRPPQSYPTRVFATTTEAIGWGRELLAQGPDEAMRSAKLEHLSERKRTL